MLLLCGVSDGSLSGCSIGECGDTGSGHGCGGCHLT